MEAGVVEYLKDTDFDLNGHITHPSQQKAVRYPQGMDQGVAVRRWVRVVEVMKRHGSKIEWQEHARKSKLRRC